METRPGQPPPPIVHPLTIAPESLQSVPPAADLVDGAADLRLVNQRLLIAGLNALQQADDVRGDLADLFALLENLNDAIIVTNGASRVMLMNRAAHALFGLPDGNTSEVAQRFDAIDRRRLDGTPQPEADWPVNRALRGERFRDSESLIVRADGVSLRIAASGSSTRDATGQIALATVIYRDVTELRVLEQLKADYIALISHDLRSPLTAILGMTQFAQRELAREVGDGSKLRQRIETIEAQARRMAAMIADLLESSRLEAGPKQLARQPCDLSRLVAGVAERLEWDDARARVQLRAADDAMTVSADRADLERVLTNLLTNALKYSPASAVVRVQIERRGSEGIVSISDDGDGIPPEQHAMIFERFTRVGGGAQTAVEGVGLGLYIARLIVEAHGGRIWVESDVGRGSTFRFALPLIDATDPDGASAE